jgi:hypothetical protein
VLISPLKVLEVPTCEDGSDVTFLDEFRIVVSPYGSTEGTSDLGVFDTRIPQNRPDGFQRFGVPPRYFCGHVHVRVDRDRPPGTVSREEPFTVDPAQAVIVMELFLLNGSGPRVLLAMQINALIARTGSYIPWEEWGGDSVVAEIPLGRNKLTTFVHGTRVAVVVLRVRRYCSLYTFDLSKRGCHALPPWDGGSGMSRRRLTLEDCRYAPLVGIRCVGTDPADMVLLGDGMMVYPDPVSCPPRSVRMVVVG